jgi:hypothetical protein
MTRRLWIVVIRSACILTCRTVDLWQEFAVPAGDSLAGARHTPKRSGSHRRPMSSGAPM